MYVVSRMLVPCFSGILRWRFHARAAIRRGDVATGLSLGLINMHLNFLLMQNTVHPHARVVSKIS